MMFLLRCLPKNYGAASFRALRMFDARPCMVPFSTSASLFEQTIDLPEAEYPLPVLQQSHAPPPKESMVQSMQQMMRNNLSISHQQEIILNAELLFQAADYQSNQAYVFLRANHLYIYIFQYDRHQDNALKPPLLTDAGLVRAASAAIFVRDTPFFPFTFGSCIVGSSY